MKKIVIKILAICLCVVSLTSVFSACGIKTTQTRQADYGSTFLLPSTGKETYKITDPDGKSVSVYEGSFVCDKLGEYSVTVENGKQSEKFKVAVSDLSAPKIVTEISKRYLAQGEKLPVPKIIISDNLDKEITPVLSVKYGETETAYETDYICDKLGKYELIIKASDTAGKVATKTVVYTVVDKDDCKVNTVLDFSNEFGKTHVIECFGYNVEYQTEITYGEYQGATKFDINGDAIADQSIRFKNLLIPDITQFDLLSTYVYYDGRENIVLSVNYAQDFNIEPKTWTKIYIRDLENLGENSTNTMLKETFNPTSANGLTFATFSNQWVGYDQGELYLTSVVGLNKLSPSLLDEMILSLPEKYDETQKEIFDEVDVYYGLLTDEERSQVNYFGLYRQKYVNHVEEMISSLPSEFSDELEPTYKKIDNFYQSLTLEEQMGLESYKEYKQKYLSYAWNKYSMQEEDGVAFYTHTPYGVSQIAVKEQKGYEPDGNRDYFDSKYYFDETVKYGDESGSTKIEVQNYYWNLDLFLNYPQIEVDSYSKMTFYVYVDGISLSERSFYLNNDIDGVVEKELKAKEWNKVEINIEDITSLQGYRISFYAGWVDPEGKNGGPWSSTLYDTDIFYISKIVLS